MDPTQDILAHAIAMHMRRHLALERLLVKVECGRILGASPPESAGQRMVAFRYGIT